MTKLNAALFLASMLSVSLASSAAEVTVAVINFSRLQSEAPQAVRARERIDNEFVQRKQKIQDQQRQIAQLELQLTDNTDFGIDERKSLQRDIRSRKLKLENAKEELENDRRLRASEESDRLRRVVSEVIAEVAVREQVDVVLERGVVTWASDRANITDRVLERMRELDRATP